MGIGLYKAKRKRDDIPGWKVYRYKDFSFE